LAKPRFYLLVVGAFSLAGLLVAIAGVYGVVAYGVACRTHEFGVRIALGARQAEILLLVLSKQAALVAAGIAVGIAGTFGSSRVFAKLLYGVGPTDPVTLTGACFLLASIALVTCYFSARRVTKLEPTVALRNE